MVFQFEHVGLDHGTSKWDVQPLRMRDLKASFGRWQAGLADVGWNSLYWDNHDQPRAVSRFGDDSPRYRRDSATCLATLLHLHRGTPYVYQGQELGMANFPFAGARRLPRRRVAQPLRHGGGRRRGPGARAGRAAHDEPGQRPHAGAVGRLAARRLHHRDAVAAGEPRPRRVERRRASATDPQSVLAHYRRLIALRHEHAGGRARRLHDAAARPRRRLRVHPRAGRRGAAGGLQREPDAVPAGRPAARGASVPSSCSATCPTRTPTRCAPGRPASSACREPTPRHRPAAARAWREPANSGEGMDDATGPPPLTVVRPGEGRAADSATAWGWRSSCGARIPADRSRSSSTRSPWGR